MKKLIPLAVLLIGAAGAVAQTVDFNQNRTFATTADRRVYNQDGTTPLVGTDFVAQLYYGANAGSLNPVTSNPVRFRNVPTSDALAGTFSGATRTLTGFVAGDVVTLQVRAFNSAGGATFDTAGVRGTSGTFTYRIPAAGDPPTAFYIENFRSFSVVPEPSVIGLGLIGITALVMLRRRK
jgi:hypothetical protein